MKKVITKARAERAEWVCDVTGEEGVAWLRLRFGYGSKHDMLELQGELSDIESDKLLRYLFKRYPKFRLMDLLEGVQIKKLHPPCPVVRYSKKRKR
jgi:hypothetical protein